MIKGDELDAKGIMSEAAGSLADFSKNNSPLKASLPREMRVCQQSSLNVVKIEEVIAD